MVNLDDVSIIIERFGRKVKMMLQEVGIMPNEVNLYAFCSTDSEKIRQHCQRAHFKFFKKPEKSEELELLEHMHHSTMKGLITRIEKVIMIAN